MSFFPMRQQQTGMYWQKFILTEIMTKYLKKDGVSHAHHNALPLLGVSSILTILLKSSHTAVNRAKAETLIHPWLFAALS